MSARCSEVLSRSPDQPEVKFLRIVERVERFLLQRFDERGDCVSDALFETLDEAMSDIYAEYDEIADWRFCREDGPVR